MARPADVAERDVSPDAANGNVEDEPTAALSADVGAEEEEEESDDYDNEEEADFEEDRQIVGDEDDEEEEEGESDGDGVEDGPKSTLTHLLLGNPNEPVDGDDFAGEEEEDEDDDDEYVYEPEPAPVLATKKRSRDDIADEEDSQDTKKAKA